MVKNKRYDGIYFQEANCKLGLKAFKVPVFFSFKVVDLENKQFIAKEFTPPGINNLIEKKEFLLIKEETDNGNLVLIKALASKSLEDDSLIIELVGKPKEEKRFFNRYTFCPEYAGKFKAFKDSNYLGDVYIQDISLKGINLITSTPEFKNLETGTKLTIVQKTQILRVEVVRIQEKRTFISLGCKIEYSSFSIINFIFKHYVEFIKELLFKNI
ncbi:PilZ domain-containing protein [Desulfurobacterium thermolithotrophum]|uniref:PilZ domain-containing protein n=1 Tax=Desulfurobacterium thermolithotrophum TaxID=64160 RepID=UPI0013D5DED3|nr:PilZ domain-containing protein [Desulfurobacterium thermolithotrophum]